MKESAAKDNEWSTYTITVQGKHIVLKVNDKVTVDYTEEEHPKREKGRERRLLAAAPSPSRATTPAATRGSGTSASNHLNKRQKDEGEG